MTSPPADSCRYSKFDQHSLHLNSFGFDSLWSGADVKSKNPTVDVAMRSFGNQMYRILDWRRSVFFRVVFGITTSVDLRCVLVCVRSAKRFCGQRQEYALESTPTNEDFLPLTIPQRTSPRQGGASKGDAVRAGRSAKVRYEKSWCGGDPTRSFNVDAARFDDDVGLGDFKFAPIVHFDFSTGRWSTGRIIAASDVERFLRLPIILGQIRWTCLYWAKYVGPAYIGPNTLGLPILGQIRWACLYNFTLTANFLFITISVQNLSWKRFYRFVTTWPWSWR